MKGHIFVEGSNTTAEDHTKPAKEYFQGLFRPVAKLTDELSESADTCLHILSEEVGVLKGNQSIADATESNQETSANLWESAQKELLTAAGEADVMVILLSTDPFEKTVCEIWPKLAKEAKPDSIWCIGAARNTLDLVDLNKLKNKNCRVISYRRTGVARIGIETREELSKIVAQKTKE